jgi:hypothetical protein
MHRLWNIFKDYVIYLEINVGYFKVYGAIYRLCTMLPKGYVSDLGAT